VIDHGRVCSSARDSICRRQKAGLRKISIPAELAAALWVWKLQCPAMGDKYTARVLKTQVIAELYLLNGRHLEIDCAGIEALRHQRRDRLFYWWS
ncbi:MAG: hypothetical protein WA836_11300, partial [Candidatus Binataceae bacterium]